MSTKPVLPGAHWWMLTLTGILFALVAALVDLKPVVDENFFFLQPTPGSVSRKKSRSISRPSRRLSWQSHPGTYLQRDTWAESKNSHKNSRTSTL